VTEWVNLKYALNMAKIREYINNKDSKALNIQIECLQNIWEEKELLLFKKIKKLKINLLEVR
jgi:hypothetical protein